MANIERLKELQNLLIKVPANQFDLGVWFSSVDSEGKEFSELAGKCGTSACAVGWACTHKEFNKQGLIYEIDGDNNGFPVYGDDTGWYAVEKFFDLSQNISEILFDESWYFDNFLDEDTNELKITTQDVAKRIQIVIDNPDEDWEYIWELVKGMENA